MTLHYVPDQGGASPRARGRRRPEGRVRGAGGSIPAGAGATARTSTTGSPAREHPRGRGGDPVARLGRRPRWGASPRARGRRRPKGREGMGQRSIPAGAGATGMELTPDLVCVEHPRGRGGDGVDAVAWLEGVGASPRARGRRRGRPRCGGPLRSIPAGAGATNPGRGGRCWPGEHPRGRGGDHDMRDEPNDETGASPRARGRPVDGVDQPEPPRSIPAGAGATPRSGKSSSSEGEHPRGRGGDGYTPDQLKKMIGASPRARYRPAQPPGGPVDRGSIPAGAGATHEGAAGDGRSGEHPRGRGGDVPLTVA